MAPCPPASPAGFEFKNKQITEMAEKLKGAVEAHQKKKEQEKKEKEAKELLGYREMDRVYRYFKEIGHEIKK